MLSHDIININICLLANIKALIHESIVFCSFLASKRGVFCIIVT